MIGFFDSGMGGLTVLAAVRRRAPHADAVYFGDTLHAPYGERQPDVLATLADNGILTLRSFGAQEIVAACNTVSPAILAGASHGARVIEMTRPTAHALRDYHGARVLLLATPATVASDIYGSALQGTVELDQLPISGLAGAIELGEREPALRSIIRRALMEKRGARYDLVVLGCTHFPFARHIIEEEAEAAFGRSIIIDPADAVASEVLRQFSVYGTGRSYFYVSKESDAFRERAQSLFPQSSVVRTL